MTICLLTNFSGFSQTISQDDTLFQITAAQLRATVKIFVEHDFLKIENSFLTERVSLFEQSGMSKDNIIGLQQSQIGNLNQIIVTKDAIIANNNTMIDNLKTQIATERTKRRRNMMLAGGVAVVGGLVLILK